MARAQPRVSALLDVPLWPTESTDEKVAQARLGPGHVVRWIERTQHIVGRHLRVKRTNQPRESRFADLRVYGRFSHACEFSLACISVSPVLVSASGPFRIA